MAKDIMKIIAIVGCWACMIYSASTWGLKAGGVVAFALFLGAIIDALQIIEDEEEADDDAGEEEE